MCESRNGQQKTSQTNSVTKIQLCNIQDTTSYIHTCIIILFNAIFYFLYFPAEEFTLVGIKGSSSLSADDSNGSELDSGWSVILRILWMYCCTVSVIKLYVHGKYIFVHHIDHFTLVDSYNEIVVYHVHIELSTLDMLISHRLQMLPCITKLAESTGLRDPGKSSRSL